MDTKIKTTCPECGCEFSLEDAISKRLHDKFREDLKANVGRIKDEYRRKEDELSAKSESIEKREEELEKLLSERIKKEKALLADSIEKNLREEFCDHIGALNAENEKRKTQLKALSNARIENEQLKRKLDEQRDQCRLEFEEEFTQSLKSESDRIREKESERAQMKLREREELIDSLKEQVEIIKRKAEQGSARLQGEVQELELEDMLCAAFVSDIIVPVPKGVNGADVVQTVRSETGIECGKIVYESKRTKAFNGEWIDKLKRDAVLVKADILVLVTETLPDGVDRSMMLDGVWVCNFRDARSIAMVLRDSLIKISTVRLSQENKGEKMRMLYDYLTGSEFSMQLEVILGGFANLEESYRKERLQMERLWKKREKELARILLNTNHFIGSLQGIAGNSVQVQFPDSPMELTD